MQINLSNAPCCLWEGGSRESYVYFTDFFVYLLWSFCACIAVAFYRNTEFVTPPRARSSNTKFEFDYYFLIMITFLLAIWLIDHYDYRKSLKAKNVRFVRQLVQHWNTRQKCIRFFGFWSNFLPLRILRSIFGALSHLRYSVPKRLCFFHSKKVNQSLTESKVRCGEVRSGMGAYAEAARHRVHLATVLLRSPSCLRPDRRQARHAHILQIGLHLTQPRSIRAAPKHGPASRIPTESDGQDPLRGFASHALRGAVGAHELWRWLVAAGFPELQVIWAYV